MSFDPSRLYVSLLNTGLQQKDNPLYQVIHDLIGAVAVVNKQTNTIISGGGSAGPAGKDGLPGPPGLSLDISDNNDSILIPGLQGFPGIQGLQGFPGLDGDSYESDFINPNPSINSLISNFTQGSVIFAGPSGVLAQNNANLFWDATNHRLGIGTNTPTSLFQLGTGSLTWGVDNVNTNNIGAPGANRPAYGFFGTAL